MAPGHAGACDLSGPVPAEGMAPPEGILSSEEICLEWQQRQGPGAGLYNMGETCFINSVLQCLTYTPPLANYFLSGLHRRSCQQQVFCMMCTMEAHICDVLQAAGSILEPLSVLESLQCVGDLFLDGRQEDAHEFFCFLLMAMQADCPTESSRRDLCPGLSDKARLREERALYPTPFLSSLELCLPSRNIIQQIFEGLLRSRLTCLSCDAVSDSYEPFLDVPLDVGGASSVSAALQGFVQPELLDGANCIRCRSCDTVAAASKGFSIQDAPPVLTLALKRFGMTGRKLSKAVEFPLSLDLRPYMSQARGELCLYSLYAVLVHRGGGSASGHYFCYVKASNGLWYRMDDTSVTPCAVGTVLRQQAYLLFYVRCSAPDTAETTASSPESPQAQAEHLSACEAGSGQLASPHCQSGNGARKRLRSRSLQQDNDPCGSASTDTTGCSPPAGRRRRTDPPNPDGASREVATAGPSPDSPKQVPVPTAAVEQTQLGIGCSPPAGRKRKADPPNSDSAPKRIRTAGPLSKAADYFRSLLHDGLCRKVEEEEVEGKKPQPKKARPLLPSAKKDSSKLK
ncbi:ubiquitin carboxyl-terminal hydrolase 42-like [Pogoniulus pusillus]|uniref:ubiquitin carboxyl-terminal hydrolase 42-like n=1 Tax=Pogoniulus pusillus TaxID=488313 RepID=UPI0030B947C9